MQQKKRGNLRTKNHLNNSNNNEKWPPFFILFCRSFDFFMNAHKIWTQCEWFSFNFNLPRILICVSSTFSPPFALYYTYSKLLMSSGIVVFFIFSLQFDDCRLVFLMRKHNFVFGWLRYFCSVRMHPTFNAACYLCFHSR